MKRFFFLFASLLFSHLIQAQIELDFFVQKAKENSPWVNENNNLLSISQIEQERLTKEFISPRIFFTADYQLSPYFNNRQFIDTNPEPQAIGYDVGITNGGLYSGLVNINQPLFAGKTLNAYLGSQRIEQQKYFYNKTLVVQNLTKNVIDQYIKVYQGQELTKMNQDLLTVIEDQASVVDKLARAALLKQSDVLLIDLEKKNQQAAQMAVRSQWQQDLMDLYTLCGISDTTSIVLAAPALPIDLNSREESSFLQQYQTDSLIIVDSIQVLETKYRPAVNLYGNAGLNAVALNHIERKVGFSAGLGLIVPLYDGHQKELNRQKAELSLNSVAGYKEMKAKEVENNIFKYKRAILALEENIESLEAQKQEYTTLLAQYKVEINAGQLSVIDYINGLKLYRQVQLNLINARMNLLLMKNAYNYWNW